MKSTNLNIKQLKVGDYVVIETPSFWKAEKAMRLEYDGGFGPLHWAPTNQWGRWHELDIVGYYLYTEEEVERILKSYDNWITDKMEENMSDKTPVRKHIKYDYNSGIQEPIDDPKHDVRVPPLKFKKRSWLVRKLLKLLGVHDASQAIKAKPGKPYSEREKKKLENIDTLGYIK